MIKALFRYIKSLQFLKALLIAIAMAIPVFSSIYFFDSMDIGFGIALGSILCVPADTNGSLNHKFYGILFSILISTTITLLVGTFSKSNDGILVNARIVGAQSKVVVASAQELIPNEVYQSKVPVPVKRDGVMIIESRKQASKSKMPMGERG